MTTPHTADSKHKQLFLVDPNGGTLTLGANGGRDSAGGSGGKGGRGGSGGTEFPPGLGGWMVGTNSVAEQVLTAQPERSRKCI
jgi:hypothetical protein